MEFPQCHEWANKDDGRALCLERDVGHSQGEVSFGMERGQEPSPFLAIRFLSHSCLGPQEFCKDQAGFLQHPTVPPPPAPDTQHPFALASARSH